jgi:Nuclease-related domain
MALRRGSTAGASAFARFADARGRWRRQVMRPALVVAAAPLAVALVAETVWGTSSLDWALGFLFGAIAGALIWVWDAPPVHIENWRRGAAGERRTARALRALEPAGWHVRHDMLADWGNRDHVLVGPSGVYLLDTKSPAGVVRVDGDVVTVDRPDDPRGSYRLERLASALRAESARLKADLEDAAGRTWVQAVVVVWGEFPQRVVGGDRIAFVHGDELVAWLRDRPVTLRAEQAAGLADAIYALRAAT